VNAAKNNLRILESILVTAYKFVLGLSKNSANKVCWFLLSLPYYNKKEIKFKVC